MPADCPPLPLERILRESFGELSWTRCRTLITSGKVKLDGETLTDCRRLVASGGVVHVNPAARRAQNRLLEPRALVHVDSQLVVVNKPTGMSTVPFDSRETDTLDELVRRTLSKRGSERLPPLGVVHRIDKDTSGLVVFARTTVAKRHLKQQFRFHTNHRAYLALVSGSPRSERIESRLIEDRGDGRRGSTTHPTLGQLAVTHVELLETFGTASLVRCRLETGRTHQIRIHLAERGHPLLGERVYGQDHAPTAHLAPRTMLHAAELGITHPTRLEDLSFSCEPPADFSSLLEQLRRG